MNITVNLEIDKREIENFQELERTIYRAVLKLGREITAKALESLDDALFGEPGRQTVSVQGVSRHMRQNNHGSGGIQAAGLSGQRCRGRAALCASAG